jgi:hypothetical protein
MSMIQHLKKLCLLGFVLASAVRAETVTPSESPALTAQASSIVKRYCDVPKGVVLEDGGEGLEELKTITFDKEKDQFVINGTATYKCPLPRKDWVKVFKSLIKDDRMGVTLVEGRPRLYGHISGDDKMVTPLVETDKLLGGILYGIPELLTVKLPGDYKPKVAKDRKIAVVAFTIFNKYQFYKNPKDNVYTRAGCNIEVQLIPLSETKTDNGGHLPDDEKMKEYVMEESDTANIEHMKKNLEEYLKIECIGQTAKMGEAAAFARWIRDSKVETKELLEKMK